MSIDEQIRQINFCVVATQAGKRKDISGPLPIFEAQERAMSLKGDNYHKRPAAVPYPYKTKKAKKK